MVHYSLMRQVTDPVGGFERYRWEGVFQQPQAFALTEDRGLVGEMGILQQLWTRRLSVGPAIVKV